MMGEVGEIRKQMWPGIGVLGIFQGIESKLRRWEKNENLEKSQKKGWNA